MEKSIKLDFRVIRDISMLHEIFQQELGFPEFYGKNIHALIDCLSSMKYPEDEMSKITLDKEDILIIKCVNLSNASVIILNNLLIAIEETNKREYDRGRNASILLECFSY